MWATKSYRLHSWDGSYGCSENNKGIHQYAFAQRSEVSETWPLALFCLARVRPVSRASSGLCNLSHGPSQTKACQMGTANPRINRGFAMQNGVLQEKWCIINGIFRYISDDMFCEAVTIRKRPNKGHSESALARQHRALSPQILQPFRLKFGIIA